MDNEKQKLFSEFPPVPVADWEAKIEADLKGADYEKKLVWRAQDGLKFRPYYTEKDLENLEYLAVLPGVFPYTRGTKVKDNNWYIRQDIKVDDVEKANEKALDILMKGVDSIGFILDEEREYTKEDLDALLKNIFAEIVEINFVCGNNALVVMENHHEMLQRYNRDFGKINGSLDYDPLGRLATTGRFYNGEDADFELCKKMIEIATHLPHFSVLNVHGQHFHNAGASIVEELAFSLAVGSEYLTQLSERGLSVNQIAPNIKFNLAVGSSYFMEIARIRAARHLWSHIVKAYGAGNEAVCRMNLHAITSRWNMTAYDPHGNMLRTTTEAMSAAIAGIDSMTVRPYNFAFEEPNDFSERIARNQQLLLKEESYLDKVVDPAAGSYYIENLTASIAEEAWKLFLETEAMGGFLQALKEGFVQDRIKETANERRLNIATRKEMLLGTNQYPNFDESSRSVFTETSAAEGKSGEVEPLVMFRGAEGFEKLRGATDKWSEKKKRPAAFMFTYGNLSMRIARSQFSRNFFACAGFETIDNLGFKTVEEGIEASVDSKAEIVVLCSSDDEYPDFAPEVAKALNNKAIIVIAGYPKDSMELLKEAGVGDFIHLRSNVLETLENFQKRLGIK
jgi:methylmalonyl-CoA mutase